jgi:hypothetical protein
LRSLYKQQRAEIAARLRAGAPIEPGPRSVTLVTKTKLEIR